ncbi:acyl-CoA thioesterase [Novosphingobium sp. FSY-8]|uniref:Acyl-CoA thioesterase n=1 Tax=Novosphingobium ovatum TaxID=1908523 RepID=A0ABW9X8V9_9SPHN|nr:acyl-CoA thioesterase [Novosphingobium ovatum]NBC34955.1 acyl-CoA thioesterase [Novosphingobium ovatum]
MSEAPEYTAFLSRPHRITWGECDPAGIVFAPRYFDMFAENAVLLFEHAGLPPKRQMLKELGVIGFPAVDMSARFLGPTSYGDDVLVETAAPDFGNSSFTLHHRLTHQGRICVECTEKRVWTVPHPDKPGAMKAARIPDDIRALFLKAPA